MHIVPRKDLGQHFLQDKQVIEKIMGRLPGTNATRSFVEVGPGQGALTEGLIARGLTPLYLVEKDKRLVPALSAQYGSRAEIIEGDFLKWPFPDRSWVVVGNFPYNISSPIFWKILHDHHKVEEVLGIVQKEVAERIASPAGSKRYGILSVLLQAFYQVEYCFSVPPTAFIPAPRVFSAVLQMKRRPQPLWKGKIDPFVTVVKMAFSQRRKMLKNVLRPFSETLKFIPDAWLRQRAEALDPATFVTLTRLLYRIEG